ncbi:hypothetical protein A2U01_0071173, partial [Trifolium medium]|nr:hypothetical protein [Trifolium medium]
MLRFETDELMVQVDDFSEFVTELHDYSWRLDRKESLFLARMLRLQRGLTADAPFVNSIEEQEWCHKEVVERLSGQIWVLKESIQ